MLSKKEDKVNKKILFFDIDGTLVTADHVVPESAKEAIAEARKSGCLAFINTGRVEAMLRQLRQEVEMDGALIGCGTQIVIGDATVFYQPLSESIKQEILAAADRYNIDVVPEGRTGAYYKPGVSRFPEVERVKSYFHDVGGILLDGYYGDYEIQKFCIQSDEKSDLNGFYTEFSPKFDIVDRKGGFYECVPRGFGKGKAIERLLDYYDVPPENAYAFGDTANDLPMFEVCGHNAAMKKHDPVLDPYASIITESPEDDGIAMAMKKFGLI